MAFSENELELSQFSNKHLQNGVYTIPNGVTHIVEFMFSLEDHITKVIIPNSVTHIGESAFFNCRSLTEIIIPNSVTHIGESAFFNCRSLTEIIIPNSVTYIGKKTFFNCTSLTKVIIPNSVTYIEDCAFFKCTSLTELTIPNSVKAIGGAFYCCRALAEVNIPTSVIYIDKSAFKGCSNLKIIATDASNRQEYERIHSLIPQEFRHLLLSYELCYEIYMEVKDVRQQALELIQPIGMDSFPMALDESLIKYIQQMDDRLHDVINQVPSPYKRSQLDEYKHALQEALNEYRNKQELLHQRSAAINKLQQVIQRTEGAITRAKKKNSNFINSPENQSKLAESQRRIAISTKLIKWLAGDKATLFTEDEKKYLSDSKNSVALILEKYSIQSDKLPEAPSRAQIKAIIERYHTKSWYGIFLSLFGIKHMSKTMQALQRCVNMQDEISAISLKELRDAIATEENNDSRKQHRISLFKGSETPDSSGTDEAIESIKSLYLGRKK